MTAAAISAMSTDCLDNKGDTLVGNIKTLAAFNQRDPVSNLSLLLTSSLPQSAPNKALLCSKCLSQNQLPDSLGLTAELYCGGTKQPLTRFLTLSKTNLSQTFAFLT